MVPRGSNGAGQAILDTRALADRLATIADPAQALTAYDDDRREATARVVRANRTGPPDAILEAVHERTGDRPFGRVEHVISTTEMDRMLSDHRTIAGYALADLAPQ